MTQAPAFAAVLAASGQALVDLAHAGCSEVALVHAPGSPELAAFSRSALDGARALGFAAARVSLARHPLTALDDVVRAVALCVSGSEQRRPGLAAMLEGFARRHGARAPSRFAEAAARLRAAGDLSSLCLEFLASRDAPRHALARLAGWLDGVSFARVDGDGRAPRALTPRTAKRALAELSRVLLALDAEGTLVVLDEGEALLSLPPRRRDDAYTVLRELVDDGDGVAGLTSTRLVVCGTTPLFQGPRSLATLAPLASRVAHVATSHGVAPHRPLLDLSAPVVDEHAPPPARPPRGSERALAAIVRAAHGLPPLDSITSMSVGHDRIDATIDKLFAAAGSAGSSFALLSGDYGAGKTHALLHLAERALRERRPVFRLSVDRLDADLGNPQRHLSRLLESSTLPGRAGARGDSVLARIGAWVRDPAKLARVLAVVGGLSTEDSERGAAARRALRYVESSPTANGAALEAYLCGDSLRDQRATPSYRLDAYRRLLLAVELLSRCEGLSGPVLMIDEVENLFTGGASLPERRTALRSLAFYCGGALPAACVVLAITPEALALLRGEAATHVSDLSAQESTLDVEDVEHFGRRLARSPVTEVASLGRDDLESLAANVRRTHASARGAVPDPGWELFVQQASRSSPTPRGFVRALVDRLESAWWSSR